MSAQTLLNELNTRGVKVWPDGDKVRFSAPRGVLTDADRASVAAVKAEMLALLTRPALGSIRNPMVVRGSRMPARCLWDGCDGELSGQSNLYLCGKCGWYFELLPPEMGVAV